MTRQTELVQSVLAIPIDDSKWVPLADVVNHWRQEASEEEQAFWRIQLPMGSLIRYTVYSKEGAPIERVELVGETGRVMTEGCACCSREYIDFYQDIEYNQYISVKDIWIG